MTEELATEPAIADKPTEATIDADAKVEAKEGAEPAPAKDMQEKDSIQKRIDKLTRDKYDALRKADIERYEKEQLKARIEALEKAKTPGTATQPPTLEGAGFDENKYQAQLLEFAKTHAEAAALKAVDQRMQSESSKQVFNEFHARQTKFIESTPDYIEKVLEQETLPISNETQEALMQMENGPEIAYYLCTHEDMAKQLMLLPPLLQMREIGRIEAGLTKPVVPKVSKAPPPPAKIEASEAAAEKNPSDMTDAEFRKWRQKQISKRTFYTN